MSVRYKKHIVAGSPEGLKTTVEQIVEDTTEALEECQERIDECATKEELADYEKCEKLTGVDLNNIDYNVIAYCDGSLNAPSGVQGGYGFLINEVSKDNSAYRKQTFKPYNADTTYTRACNNGTWTSWEKLVTESALNSTLNGALTEQQTIKAININSDEELWNYFVNIGQAKTGSININYNSTYFANSYGSFIYTVGSDPNMINGYFSKLYDDEKYYVRINIFNREILTTQLATKNDLKNKIISTTMIINGNNQNSIDIDLSNFVGPYESKFFTWQCSIGSPEIDPDLYVTGIHQRNEQGVAIRVYFNKLFTAAVMRLNITAIHIS